MARKINIAKAVSKVEVYQTKITAILDGIKESLEPATEKKARKPHSEKVAKKVTKTSKNAKNAKKTKADKPVKRAYIRKNTDKDEEPKKIRKAKKVKKNVKADKTVKKSKKLMKTKKRKHVELDGD